ncbi:MAG: hypothetical protein M1823_005144 [Watsoniomyces obsoletus]|nr:MAG: hypothetical protein M1823_005144 [Watsoniomyces obsoletus]
MASPGTPGSWQADFPPYSPLTPIVDPSSVLPSMERAETPTVLPGMTLFQRQLSLRPQRDTATLVPERPGTQQDPLDVDAAPASSNPGSAGGGNPAGVSSSQARAGVRQQRVRLTDGDRVELVRTCIAHAGAYRLGKVTDFWKMIGGIFSQKTGKCFREPRHLVTRLVQERKIQLKLQETQSGVLQEATELTNALDCWMVVLAEFEDVQIDRRQNREDAERQREDTQRQTEELMVSIGRRKRVRTREDESDRGDDGEPDGYSTHDTLASRGSGSAARRRPRRRFNRSASQNGGDKAFETMAEAHDRLATSMANMVTGSGVEKGVVKRLESLEELVNEIKDTVGELIKEIREDMEDLVDRKNQELLHSLVGLLRQ